MLATLLLNSLLISFPAPAAQITFESKNELLKSDKEIKLSANSPLVQMKQAYNLQKADECLAASRKAKASGPLRPWVVKQQLECLALKKNLKPEDKNTLKAAVEAVEKNSHWLIETPFAPFFQVPYVEGLLNYLEIQLKSDRKNGWKVFDRLQGFQSMLNSEQKARLYRMAGELAFVEQNLMLAISYFNRSINEKDSLDLRKRVDSLKVAMKIKSEPPPPAPSAKEETVGVSEEELRVIAPPAEAPSPEAAAPAQPPTEGAAEAALEKEAEERARAIAAAGQVS